MSNVPSYLIDLIDHELMTWQMLVPFWYSWYSYNLHLDKYDFDFIDSIKAERSIVRQQRWHEHNLTGYNITNERQKIIATISKQP